MSAARSRRLLRFALATTAGIAALVALYAAIVGLWLPGQIERRVTGALQGHGHALSVGALSVHPFTLVLQARDIRLSSSATGTDAEVKSLRADLAWHSLIARRWQLSECVLDGVALSWTQRATQATPAPTPEPARAARALPALEIARLTASFSRVTLQAQALSAPLTLQNARLDMHGLSTAMGATPARFRIDAPLPDGGRLGVDGELGVASRASQGRFRLTGARPDFWWPRLLPASGARASGGRADLQAHYSIDLNGAPLHAAVLEALQVDARGLRLEPVGGGPALLALERLSLAGGRLLWGSRQLRLDRLRLESGQLDLRTDARGRLNWAGLAGDGGQDDAARPWRIELPDLSAEGLAVHYEDTGAGGRPAVKADVTRLSGRLQAELTTAPMRFSASAIDAALAGARIELGRQAPLGAAWVALRGAHLDSGKRRLAARRVDVDGLLLRVELDRSGRPRWPGAGATGAGKAAESGNGSDSDSGWDYRMDELALNGLTLQLAGPGSGPPLLALKGDALLGDLRRGTLPRSGRADLRDGDTRVQLQGGTEDGGRSGTAWLKVEALPLDRSASLLRSLSGFNLSARRLDTALQLRFGGRAVLRAAGEATLGDLHLADRNAGETVLKAARVQASGRFDWGARRLHLGRVRLEDAQGRIAIDARRRLNLGHLREPGGAGAGKDASAHRPLKFRIDRLDVARGRLDFADDSLVLPFAARIDRLQAQLNGIDNDPRGEATVEARGRIAPHGEARAEGRFRPAAPDRMTDLRVRFDNIDMPLLSPYSATFAGRKIASGRLWLDLRYRIRDRTLDGLNIATLQDVALGERIREGGIGDSALELALALLQDRDGRARVEVPVRGDLDDAHILYRGLIGDALGNTLKRVASAPFRLLGRLFGDDEALSGTLAFDPGSSRLHAGERAQLDRLAGALAERPQLGLRLHPAYDGREDARALREAGLGSEVARRAGLPDDGGLLDFGHPAVQRAVAALYRERIDASERISVSAGDAGEAARHRALFARLVDAQTVSPDALAALAQQRADAARQGLVARGLDPSRIDVAPPQEKSGDHGGMDFELHVRDR